jgi:hypothetical protein
VLAIVIGIEDGLSAGSPQDYVVQIVRIAHAWEEDRLASGATQRHCEQNPIYLTLYREKFPAGRVSAGGTIRVPGRAEPPGVARPGEGAR